jgi:hypothetical protein
MAEGDRNTQLTCNNRKYTDVLDGNLTVYLLVTENTNTFYPRQGQHFVLAWKANMVKVKESRNRPGVTQEVPGGLGSQISWHSTREGGKVVSLMHRPPLPPEMYLILIFNGGWVDPRAMERSEGDMSLKNPVTPPGIDPGIIRLVAQLLSHYATPGPQANMDVTKIWKAYKFDSRIREKVPSAVPF